MRILLTPYLPNTGTSHLQWTTLVALNQYFTLFYVSPQVMMFPYFIHVRAIFFVKTLIFLGFFLLHVLLIYKSHKYKRHSCMVNIFYYFFSLCQSFSNIKVLGFFIHLNSFCVLRNLFLFKVTDMVYCIILWMLYYYLWQAAECQVLFMLRIMFHISCRYIYLTQSCLMKGPCFCPELWIECTCMCGWLSWISWIHHVQIPSCLIYICSYQNWVSSPWGVT